MKTPTSTKVIEEGYELYRTRDDGPDADTAIAFRDQYTWGLVPMKFVGVWDTVGSLGIPFGVQGMINNDRYAFHDTRLSGIVEHSDHALAVDEYREDYEPTLWKGPKPESTEGRPWGQPLKKLEGAPVNLGYWF